METGVTIRRIIEKQIGARIGKGKVILVFGPRQSGKTTLVRMIAASSGLDTLWLSGDEPDTRGLLAEATSTRLKALIGNKRLVIIDEAQRIANIGITLKLCADTLPGGHHWGQVRLHAFLISQAAIRQSESSSPRLLQPPP